MANCTYTIRRPGNVAWTEGIIALSDAADEREAANRIAPGHEIYAVWGNGETTEVSAADIVDAINEADPEYSIQAERDC